MLNNAKRFVAIGECMLELTHTSPTDLKLGFSGDTYNVALYLARLSRRAGLDVAYFTAIGDDPYSNMMLDSWQQSRINCEFVQQLPNRMAGLHFVNTDEKGERSLYYYRSEAAARSMLDAYDLDSLITQLQALDIIYISSVSFAILHTDKQNLLFDALQQCRLTGATICFDTNYRSRLWPSVQTAQTLISRILSTVDVALPSFDDEANLFGDKTPTDTAARMHDLGVKEVIVKSSAADILISIDGQQDWRPCEVVKQPVDTTCAGDSFNSAYLSARIRGLDSKTAVRWGQKLASEVIQHRGAVIPESAMPQLY